MLFQICGFGEFMEQEMNFSLQNMMGQAPLKLIKRSPQAWLVMWPKDIGQEFRKNNGKRLSGQNRDFEIEQLTFELTIDQMEEVVREELRIHDLQGLRHAHKNQTRNFYP